MKRVLSIAVSSLLVLSIGLTGCTLPIVGEIAPSKAEPVVLTPKVSSPTVMKEGVLTVGLDYSYAPFAGESNGKVVGIDADVAAALAQELGLKVEFVDIGSAGGPNSVAQGRCDIFMNFEKNEANKTVSTYAGTYLFDAPSLFTISSTGKSVSVDLNSIGIATIAAQKGSTTAEQVLDLYGSSALIETNNLVEAFSSLESGRVTYTAASGVVGSYIATSYSDIVFCGAIATPHEIGIGVASQNTNLQAAVASALSTISSNGVLDVVPQ